MSMLKRFQKAASDVGKQAQAAGTILASQLDEGGKQIQGQQVLYDYVYSC